MADPLVPYMDPMQQQMMLQFLMTGGGGFMPIGMAPDTFQLANMMNSGAPGWGTDYSLEDEGAEVDYSGNRTQLSGIMSLMADPMLRGMVGGAGFQPGAFNPTVEFGDVDSSLQEAYRNAQRWQNVGGIEGLTARKAAVGESPSQIMNHVMTLATLEPDSDAYESYLSAAEASGSSREEAEAEYNAVQEALPTFATNQPDIGTAQQWGPGVQAGTNIDSSTLQGIISDVYADVSAGTDIMGNLYDPEANPGGMYVDEGGMLRTRQEVPSAIAEHFDELGLPYPTAEYDLNFLAENVPGFAENYAGAQESQAVADSLYDQAMRPQPRTQQIVDPTEAWGYNAGRTDEVPVGPGGETGGEGGLSNVEKVVSMIGGLVPSLLIGSGQDEPEPRAVRGNDNAQGLRPRRTGGRAGQVTYDIPDPEEELARMRTGGSWAAVDQAIADSYNDPVAMAQRSNAEAGSVPTLGGGRQQINFGGQMMSPMAAYSRSALDAARQRQAGWQDQINMMSLQNAGRRPFTDALMAASRPLQTAGVIPGGGSGVNAGGLFGY